MSAYTAVRDWVDRCWRGSGYKASLLPAALPLLLALWTSNAFLSIAAFAWFALWAAFVMWRGALLMRSTLNDMKDEPYDRVGKYRLSKEYWATESAAAARYRKKKMNG